jgi:hypothetical protein
MSATEEDINDVSAWAEIIVSDLLWKVPHEIREDVLQLALARSAAVAWRVFGLRKKLLRRACLIGGTRLGI